MKAIVITSIFSPTEAILKFANNNDYKLYVIGDKKSPKDWQCQNARFISVEEQNELSYMISETIPYNHYCRKMIGYLEAIKDGAKYICDTDDDNIPYDDWTFPKFNGNFEVIPNDRGFINIYQLYTEQKIWPRGLPLNLINKDFALEETLKIKNVKIGIWQGLADEDPDVDAIYRLTNDHPCYFKKRGPIALGNGTITPFNTQNTLIRKELFPLMYLPTYVTFRYTDILRGLVAQPIMWAAGYLLGFTNATVIQKRNPHNYMKDFISEIPMYETCEKVIELTLKVINGNNTIEDNLYNAYCSLLDNNIVKQEELYNLELWLKDINTLK